CVAGQSWVWDGVVFTILSPAEQAGSDNDNSCVLQVQSIHGTALLTGDIEAAAETWLVKRYGDRLTSDVLIAPHHGSKTSSTRTFLQTVNAKNILIPAGYRNQFGHPHNEVLARYRDISAHWLISANSGAITVSVNNNVWQIQTRRQTNNHYWNFKP
ncbi:MAG: DNA internalization-related competence protein ComEC/Rec2, partial [Methylococcales bacterium]|nr:DNA internalization-related competence protein ComEC/Rec2 [Methylococcales bacterium]